MRGILDAGSKMIIFGRNLVRATYLNGEIRSHWNNLVILFYEIGIPISKAKTTSAGA